MRVLCLTPWWPDGPDDGRGSFIADQVAALRELGVTVDVMVVDRRRRRDGCRHVRFGWLPRYLAHGWEAPALALRLRLARLDLGDHDVVHAHGETLGAAVAMLGAAAPLVVTIHGETTSARAAASVRRRRQMAMVGQRATVVVVGRPLLATWAGRAERVVVVPNGFDAATFAPRPLPPGPPWRMVSVSNLLRTKGVHLVVAAVARLRAAGVPVELDVVGEGGERAALERSVADAGLGGVVRFHGRGSRPEVAAALADAHLFCLPSAPEAFGVAYLEACGTGRPVVGCRGEGAAELVTDGVEGWLVEPGDVDGLVVAASEAFSDRSRLEAMATAAATRAHRDFPWSVNAQRLLDVFSGLVR